MGLSGLTSSPSCPLSNAGASHAFQPCLAPGLTDPLLAATSVNHLKLLLHRFGLQSLYFDISNKKGNIVVYCLYIERQTELDHIDS